MEEELVSPSRIEELELKVAKLEQRFREASPVIDEHEDRLDDHERRLQAIQTSLDTFTRKVDTLSSTVGRLADIATSQGLTLERVLRNTNRLVEIFEPTVVVGAEGEQPRG
jgi:chromosome segregation ATPase